MPNLDDDGQPRAGFHRWRNLEKSIDTLLGICAGLVADNRINRDEALFLDTWLRDNNDVATDWPGDVITQRVSTILHDGIVTDEELLDLRDTLTKLVGGSFSDNGTASGMATRLPIDQNALITIEGRSFCLTGKFIFGSRGACERAIAELGGNPIKQIVQSLDYLVIGTLASRDWMYSSHGRKIERAVEYRKKNGKPIILAEEDWNRVIHGARTQRTVR